MVEIVTDQVAQQMQIFIRIELLISFHIYFPLVVAFECCN